MYVLTIARFRDIIWFAFTTLITVAIVIPVGLAFRHGPNLPIVHFDMPLYTSVKDLAANSDLIVYGTIGPVVSRQIDYGSATRQTDGIPMVFHQVTITETLKGPVHGTVVVAVPDKDEIAFAGHSPELKRNQGLILFLQAENAATAPGVTPLDRMYTPLGLDNGMFDQEAEGSFTPRQSAFFDSASFSLEDLRQKTQGYNPTTPPARGWPPL